MATPAMQAAAEQLLSYQRMTMEDGSESHLSQGMILPKEGKMDLFAFMVDLDKDAKQEIAGTLLMKVLAAGDEAISGFVSDSWRGTPPPGVDYRTLPRNLSEWPKEYVQEILVCAINQIGQKGAVFTQEYTRDKNNKPIWGKIVNTSDEMEAQGGAASGRFLFDLTPEKLAPVREVLKLLDGPK